MNSGQGKIFLNKVIKCVRHKRLMSSMILKLEISVNKITIKIMEEQAFIWNEVFPIYINKNQNCKYINIFGKKVKFKRTMYKRHG